MGAKATGQRPVACRRPTCNDCGMSKLAVVTGASSGIGAATAKQLADAGWDVVAAARRVDRLQELAASNPRITPVELDVTSDESVDALVASLGDRAVHLLVANAGGAFDAKHVTDADLESWRKTYEVNVIGTVRTIRALVPKLRASNDGHVIVTGSTAGFTVYETGGSYTAAKHGEHALAGTLRLELAGEPIRVSVIAPGMVKTDEFALVRNAGDAAKAAKVYEGVESPLTADDVADTIVWVATRPSHVNVDLLVVRPLAQAAQHKVVRKP